MKKDRLDIAHVIYEWWKTRKNKEDYLNSIITVEQYLGIDRLDPVTEFEEIGAKIYIKYNNKPDEIIYKEMEKIKDIRAALSSCSTCDHEIYVKFNEGEEERGKEDWYWNRDCMCLNIDCSNHFNNIVKNRTTREPIQPVYNCPYWKQRIKELPTDYEQTTTIVSTSKRLGKKRGKYTKHPRTNNGRIRIRQI